MNPARKPILTYMHRPTLFPSSTALLFKSEYRIVRRVTTKRRMDPFTVETEFISEKSKRVMEPLTKSPTPSYESQTLH